MCFLASRNRAMPSEGRNPGVRNEKSRRREQGSCRAVFGTGMTDLRRHVSALGNQAKRTLTPPTSPGIWRGNSIPSLRLPTVPHEAPDGACGKALGIEGGSGGSGSQ